MRTVREVQLEHYMKHPEELDSLLNVSLEEFYVHEDLRVVADTIGIISTVKNIPITVTPDWGSIVQAITTLGYKVVAQPLSKAA